MFTPNDPQLNEIIDNATDDLVSEVDMFLDEGSWISKVYYRCDALGISVLDSAKLREVAEELMALKVARHLLQRLVAEPTEARSGSVFIQGAGWIEPIRKEEDGE